MGCQRSGYEINPELAWVELDIYLSDQDVKRLDALIAGGTGASGIYWGLVRMGVISTAAISPPLAAVLGGVIIVNWAWIKWTNSGNGKCGVHITVSLTFGGASGFWVNSQ